MSQNAGKAANALLKGKGNIIEIGGLLGSSPENDRHNGFLDYIKSIPNLKFVKKLMVIGSAQVLKKN